MNDGLDLWALYDKPRDCPEFYIARRFRIEADASYSTADFMLNANIDQLRHRLRRRGLVCIGRRPEDDPVIVEVWI